MGTPVLLARGSVAVAVVILVLLAFIGWGVLYFVPEGTNLVADTGTSTPTLVSNTAQEALPTYPSDLVTLYWVEEYQTSERERSWPTKSVWIKKGAAAPEHLATVGKVGEYPARFLLSPDHKYIAIDLDHRIDLLEIATNKVQQLITLPNHVAGLTFAQDSSTLWVSEAGIYGQGDRAIYKIHSVDLATGQDTVRATGNNADIKGDLALYKVRDDGTVFYHTLTYTEGGPPPGALNLATGERRVVNGGYYMSMDGTRALEPLENTPDTGCSEFGPSVARIRMKVVEPVTRQEFGTVGIANKAFLFIAFSPDAKEVLYATAPVPIDCSYQPADAYYRQAVTGEQPQKVTDPIALLKTWQSPQFGMDFERDQAGKATMPFSSILYLGPTRLAQGIPPIRAATAHAGIIGGDYEKVQLAI